MATPLQEARERLASVKARIANEKAEREAKRAIAAKVAAREAKRVKPLRAITALVVRPGQQIIRTTLDLRDSYVGYVAPAKEALTLPERKRLARLVELAAAGQIKVNPPGGGNGLSAKGLATKLRTIDKAAVRRIEADYRAMRRADEAASKAHRKYEARLAAEYEAGGRVAPDTIATIVAEAALHSLMLDATRGTVYAEWDQRRDADAIAAAEAHLAHVKSKSKDPCPCQPCVETRRREGWAKEHAARAAAEAARQAELEKAIKRAPKVRFLCPSCEVESIAPVFGETVDCQNEDCGQRLTLAALRTTKVAKSETPQAIYGEAETEAA